jgi:hypothetical protein
MQVKCCIEPFCSTASGKGEEPCNCGKGKKEQALELSVTEVQI